MAVFQDETCKLDSVLVYFKHWASLRKTDSCRSVKLKSKWTSDRLIMTSSLRA